MRTPTVGKIFDAVEVRNMGDVDEPFWPADVSLHQVQKIGAGSKISGARLGSGFNGLAYCRRPHIIKAVSCDLLAVCRVERLLCLQHGFGDALIGAATAEIATHALAHPFRIVTRQAFLEQSRWRS